MKANEAPEKLYITNEEKRFSDKCHSASTEKYVDNDIEYVRTDAFIEKAWEWVNMYFHETEVNDRWGESRYVVMSGHDVFKDDLLKDFKNYMKGE